MIFVTIGTQAPFDRLIKILDEMAPELNEEIIAQTYHGDYKPKHIRTMDFIPPNEFNDFFSKARLIVAHAGMGTVISALTLDKPIIIFPRLASWGEHRNDHQMATTMRLNELGFVYAAYDKKQLCELLRRNDLKPLMHISDNASQSLIDSLSVFIRKMY